MSFISRSEKGSEINYNAPGFKTTIVPTERDQKVMGGIVFPSNPEMVASAINRSDAQVQITAGKVSQYITHQFACNSSLNKKEYSQQLLKGVESYVVTRGVTGAGDESGPIKMMRRVTASAARAVAYTGAPDTKSRALEQAKWIFTQEMKAANRKGIEYLGKQEGKNYYRCRYLVDALFTPESRIFSEKEIAPLKEEKKNLLELAENSKKSPEKIKIDQEECLVSFEPIFVSQAFDGSYESSQLLPKWLASKGFSDIDNFKERLPTFAIKLPQKGSQHPSSDKDRPPFPFDKTQSLSNRWDPLTREWKSNMSPEEQLLQLAALAEEVKLPMVVHSVGGRDQTALAVALLAAWDGSQQKDDIKALLKDEGFKQLFVGNLMAEHHFSNYAKGGGNAQVLGIHRGDAFDLPLSNNPLLSRLLPLAYLKENHRTMKLAFMAIPLFIGGCLVSLMGLFASLKNSVKDRSALPFIKFLFLGGFLRDFLRFMLHVEKLFPRYVFNEAIAPLLTLDKKVEISPFILETINLFQTIDKQKISSLLQFLNQEPPLNFKELGEEEKGLIVHMQTACIKKEDFWEQFFQAVPSSEKGRIPKAFKDFTQQYLAAKWFSADTEEKEQERFQSLLHSGKWTLSLPMADPLINHDENFEKKQAEQMALDYFRNADMKIDNRPLCELLGGWNEYTTAFNQTQKELMGSLQELNQTQKELMGSLQELNQTQKKLMGSLQELDQKQKELAKKIEEQSNPDLSGKILTKRFISHIGLDISIFMEESKKQQSLIQQLCERGEGEKSVDNETIKHCQNLLCKQQKDINALKQHLEKMILSDKLEEISEWKKGISRRNYLRALGEMQQGGTAEILMFVQWILFKFFKANPEGYGNLGVPTSFSMKVDSASEKIGLSFNSRIVRSEEGKRYIIKDSPQIEKVLGDKTTITVCFNGAKEEKIPM